MEALKMERQMNNWNDDRLDELSQATKDGFAEVRSEMKEGFATVDKRFERVEGEMKEGFAQMATKNELGEVKSELRDLNQKLLAGAVSLVVTILAGSFLTLIT